MVPAMSLLARLSAPVLLVLAPLAACAALPGRGPVAVWPQDRSDLPVDPAVTYGEFDNGLRYAILHNATPTGVGALRLRIDAGSLMEAEDQRGLAHVLEHMAFNGSENVPEGEMIRILERAGLEFGPDTNAYTSYDETVYQLDLPVSDDPTLDAAFLLMGEIADNLLIDPEALDRERGVVLSEMRVRNTYSYRYQIAAQDFLYEGARFTERSPIGTEDVLRNAPAQRVRDFYEAYYRPERALVVFVGDAPVEDIEARIAETFGDWIGAAPDGGDPDLGAPIDRPLEAAEFVDPDMPTVVTVSTSKPAQPFVDTARWRRDRLIRNIGFGILTRRLQSMARAEDAPFISASAGYSRAFDTLESASLNIQADEGAWAEALAAGEQELRRALEYGFTQAELDEQIAGLRAAIQASADGAATRRSPGLADQIASTFSEGMVFTHPSTDLARFEALAGTLTVEEVEAAFRAAWGEEEPLIYIGAATTIEEAPDAIVAAYLDSEATPVDAGAAVERGEFAYDDFGPAGEIAEQDLVEDLGITRIRFANNVRLNAKQTDFADDRVTVRVRFGGGRLEIPKDLPGLELLADSTFTAGGLEAHSIDDLQSLLAGRNVGLSFQTTDDAFALSAVTTPQDFELQLKLFAAYLTAPGWREEARTRYRRSLPAWYESIDSDPTGVQSRDVPRLLRSGDPRYGVPSLADLDSRTLDEARRVLADALSKGAVEIAVVGDLPVETAIAGVAASFGALPERLADEPRFAEARALSFPTAPAEPLVLHHGGEADRALALVYWPGVDDADVELDRAITLAKDVLQLKLTDRVREADGASYSPGAFAYFSSVNPGYGYIGVSLDIEPELVEGYFDTVDEIVIAIAAGDVSDDEIDRARAPILADIEQSLESNGYWAGLASVAQSEPRYLDDHRSRAESYRALTREDVIAAAQRFLRADQAYRIAILPEPKETAAAGGGGASGGR